MNDVNKEFLGIVNAYTAIEAREFVDDRLQMMNRWIERRERNGLETGVLDFVDKLLAEPNKKSVVVRMLAITLWRLRELEKGKSDGAD